MEGWIGLKSTPMTLTTLERNKKILLENFDAG